MQFRYETILQYEVYVSYMIQLDNRIIEWYIHVQDIKLNNKYTSGVNHTDDEILQMDLRVYIYVYVFVWNLNFYSYINYLTEISRTQNWTRLTTVYNVLDLKQIKIIC